MQPQRLRLLGTLPIKHLIGIKRRPTPGPQKCLFFDLHPLAQHRIRIKDQGGRVDVVERQALPIRASPFHGDGIVIVDSGIIDISIKIPLQRIHIDFTSVRQCGNKRQRRIDRLGAGSGTPAISLIFQAHAVELHRFEVFLPRDSTPAY
ncbi:hypothetical protein D3C80_591390 [compost metagenome]